MECFKIENLSFTYPNAQAKTLDGISFSVNQGEFVTICGISGCGKTTLLRLLKTPLEPYGTKEGKIYFCGKELSECTPSEQAAKIGFVMQNPDNQLVTDKVWHELSFGLESLGVSTPEIRTRVAEMASFFGIQAWFYKDVCELSGGQKQLLNLASVMVMQPTVLVLDEPTSQLDPIAAQDFIKALEKINRELGVAVILTEHRTEDVFPVSHRVIVMDGGKIIANDTPQTVGEVLKKFHHPMELALPVPIRVYGAVPNELSCPLTVRDGRLWLESYARRHKLFPERIPCDPPMPEDSPKVIEVRDVWFRYRKNLPDVVKKLSFDVHRGELFAVVGGNGTGKTTALSLICGLNRPYRGNVFINGKDISKSALPGKETAVLPQNPQSLFVKKTVRLDLAEALSDKRLSLAEKEEKITRISSLCRVDDLLESHPYDLSGGEQQRAALAKVLLTDPQILLLDEPTKGMDAHFKSEFAEILQRLKSDGVTIVMVSHDIEFCAVFADRCAMFFDGGITSVGRPKEFFSGKSFYTTSANRMARALLPTAVSADDIISACGGTLPKNDSKILPNRKLPHSTEQPAPLPKKKPFFRFALGGIFAVIFLCACIVGFYGISFMPIVAALAAAVSLLCFLPSQKPLSVTLVPPGSAAQRGKGAVLSAIFLLTAVPLTLYIGTHFLENKKYYFISLCIIFETMLPFFMMFENRKPKARELVIISVLCALTVVGRGAFFMLPQFKPVVAMVIISGICLGGETGFLVGAMSAFVSNFFFGQGPWTPWQMFSFGLIGFLAGIIFKKVKKTKLSLCIFGFFATFLLYGGIMNSASVIMWQGKITKEMFASAYVAGIPFDLVHALATVFFLWVLSEAMIEKLERIKIKYGIANR